MEGVQRAAGQMDTFRPRRLIAKRLDRESRVGSPRTQEGHMKRARGIILAGTCAARHMSSRLQGSRHNTAFWLPKTLNWRRTPRFRVLRHHENRQAVSWTSIFAPRFIQHFTSNVSAATNSRIFATTNSILKPLLTQCNSLLHHRETQRTYFSRERLFSQSSERHSSVERV